jgi:hypothetical protein
VGGEDKEPRASSGGGTVGLFQRAPRQLWPKLYRPRSYTAISVSHELWNPDRLKSAKAGRVCSDIDSIPGERNRLAPRPFRNPL